MLSILFFVAGLSFLAAADTHDALRVVGYVCVVACAITSLLGALSLHLEHVADMRAPEAVALTSVSTQPSFTPS